MKQKILFALVVTSCLGLAACNKQEKAPASTVDSAAPVVAENTQVTAEQQAAINSIDQPVLDEKNTDIPAEIANAPADAATAGE